LIEKYVNRIDEFSAGELEEKLKIEISKLVKNKKLTIRFQSNENDNSNEEVEEVQDQVSFRDES
jgi:cytochrome c oxidase assembly protein Cox11